MIPIELNILANVLSGRLYGITQCITSVSTDTRTLQKNGMFIALVGKRLDGHDYIEDAMAKGATVILSEKKVPHPPQVSVLVVADTTKALGTLASYIKQKVNPWSFALTGSCGKTTVKEILGQIMSFQGQVHMTQGNFNNHIGVPLTLLGLEAQHEYAVFELGANHQGEIDYTSGLIEPDVALVNNIAPAHLEGFGSIEGIAAAKSEIYQHIKPNGFAVVNRDDAFADLLSQRSEHCQQIFFSVQEVADVYATELQKNAMGCYRFNLNIKERTEVVQLKLAGRHQVHNALAAAAMAHAQGVDVRKIAQGIQLVTGVQGRMQLHQYANVVLVDDTYNASPKSVEAAIDWLSETEGCKWLVLGDLAEMGADTKNWHQHLGTYALQKNLDQVFTLGQLSAATSAAFGSNHHHYHEFPALCQALKQQLCNSKHVNILVKGSRGAHMERVVLALENMLNQKDNQSC
jgi:UDP-N-acetylmuramoyl-tripeptide--D-alanyl-D-alanine ligase